MRQSHRKFVLLTSHLLWMSREDCVISQMNDLPGNEGDMLINPVFRDVQLLNGSQSINTVLLMSMLFSSI